MLTSCFLPTVVGLLASATLGSLRFFKSFSLHVQIVTPLQTDRSMLGTGTINSIWFCGAAFVPPILVKILGRRRAPHADVPSTAVSEVNLQNADQPSTAALGSCTEDALASMVAELKLLRTTAAQLEARNSATLLRVVDELRLLRGAEHADAPSLPTSASQLVERLESRDS